MMVSRVVLLVPLVVLSLVGCSGGEPDAMPSPAPPLPPVTHPAVAVPQDRDERAVVAALARLDPCKLLDPAKAKVPRFPAGLVPVPRGPHLCELTNAGYEKVQVNLGVRWNRAKRFDAELRTAGGTKIYVERWPSCRAAIPVSFSLTVDLHLSLLGAKSGQCRDLTAFAVAAAAALAKPETMVTGRPFDPWDACTVLGRALGQLAGSARLIVGSRLESGIDECEHDTGGARGATMLTLRYGSGPGEEEGEKVVDLDGKRVYVSRDPYCVLTWNQGPSGVRARNRAAVEVSVRTKDCTGASRLARAAMKVLAGAAPRPAVVQQPLLYRADEPDVAAAGACADLAETYQCVPYHEVPVPAGGHEVVRAAVADRHVDCAVAVAAVRKQFGPALRPVVSAGLVGAPANDGGCAFVEPSHATEVWIAIRPDGREPLTVLSGSGEPWQTTVAGRSAVARNTGMGSGTFIVVQLTDDPDGPQLVGEAQFRQPRGTGNLTGPPARSAATELTTVLTGILAAHFS